MRSYLTPPPQHHLILASQSPRRKQLLVDAGIILHQIAAADIDETPDNAELPVPYALRMAQKKAEVIAANSSGQFVLAADTVVACGRRILPKAETPEQAAACLDIIVWPGTPGLWRDLFMSARWADADPSICQPSEVQGSG